MTDDKDKVVSLVPRPSQGDALEAALEDMIRTATPLARLRRAHYVASLEEGFSETEALVLCQKVTI
jgi:hypothetical protein